MEKKILIAVDDSPCAGSAVRYAAMVSPWVAGMSFELFAVQPMISWFLIDEARRKPSAIKELDRVAQANAAAGRAMLESQKAVLLDAGVDESRITAVSRPHERGVALDIIEYGQDNRFDAVVLGRRGLSGLQEVFVGSVSGSVIQNSRVTPVWVVGQGVLPGRILVAVDGSESALRAVDHLSFMVGGASIPLTLLHVRPRFSDVCAIDFDRDASADLKDAFDQGSRRCVDDFTARARKIFADHGIDNDRVRIKTVEGLSKPGAAIVKEAKSGDFDTIVMGRRGINRSLFTGSVTHYVLNKLSDRAIWIVP